MAGHKYPSVVSKSISVILSCGRDKTFIFPAYIYIYFFPRGYLGVWYPSVNTKEPEFFLNATCRHASFSSLHSTESKIMNLIFLESTCSSLTQKRTFCGQKKFISRFWSRDKNPFQTIEIAFYVSVFSGCFDIIWWIHSFWGCSLQSSWFSLYS